MRKKLLTLGTLAVMIAAKAQVTYVGEGAKFFVSTDALVYSGGNWMLDSNTAQTVENKGNIIIVGNYLQGTGKAIDGKEFVNVYTSAKDYGQVKILSATADATAKMTVQRPAASSGYFGASYAISFPYVDKVPYVMNSFGLAESQFRGDCQLNTICANRYKMTLTKWNNDKLHHDAVLATTDTFKAGDYYNLNLREKNMQTVMTGTISYKGTPSGKSYSRTAKGIIPGATEAQFTSAKYNTWKVMTNPYGEPYETYLGYVNTDDRLYGKNTYRFGNPYTSNLDLSAFTGSNAWLKILNNGGNRDILAATTDKLIEDFTVTKRQGTYTVKWSHFSGAINGADNYYKAKFDGTQWTGDAEALLIRPTETFNLYFESLYPIALGRTRVVNIQVDLNDNHKTFDHVPSAKTTTSTGLVTTGTTSFRSMSAVSRTTSLGANFHQLKISLIKDNSSLGSSFLVGTNYNSETGDVSPSDNSIFVYGVKNDEVAYDSKKTFNGFNSLSYIGKPLGVGFNNLTNGATYQLAFNLYEGSIFNEIERPSEFFLRDTKTEDVIRIDPAKTYSFVADKDIANRFVVYWKQAPQTKKEEPTKTDEVVKLSTTTATSSQNTVVYEETGKGKIRFENISNKADIQVYNVSGRLVYATAGVSTNTDYTINVNAPGMYVVKVTYQNGEVRTIKFINK